MIRMVLFAIGFVAITVALVVIQPGAQRSAPDVLMEQPVTRAEPGLPTGGLGSAPQTDPPRMEEATLAVPRASSAQAAAPVLNPYANPSQRPALSGLAGSDAPLDDQEMRRMTWETLSSLNHATGRESAPGQPGSLLHTIVRRSLDGVPESARPAQSATPELYVVAPGDSLVSIAEKVYGDVNMTGPLFAANQSILTRPDDLTAGQTLVLPPR